jgi:hypothetical protein
MTTRRAAESLLFETPLLNKGTPEKVAIIDKPAKLPEPMTTSPSPTRRRVHPLYCPSCGSWVNVELQPIRLRCSGCGVEADA